MKVDTITIKQHDEAYIKLECDPGIMYEIADVFTFDVPGAKFMQSYKTGRWDGKIRLINPLIGLLYKGLTYKVEEFCAARNYELIHEETNNDDSVSVFEVKEFISTLNLPFEVRDYQLNAIVHALRKRRSLLLSPTASGKSLIIYAILRWYNRKSLVVVPTVGLVHQMAGDFISYGYEGEPHKIMADRDKDSDSQIFISTWQSLIKMPKSWFQQFDVVVGDEAHGFKAKSLITIMTNINQCKYRFGTTGTLDGTQVNALVLEGLFGKTLQVTTTAKLMSDKHVADLNIKLLLLKHSNETRALAKNMDYQTEIDYIVTSQKRNKFIRNLTLAQQGNTLVLFQFVEKHGKILYNLINEEKKKRKLEIKFDLSIKPNLPELLLLQNKMFKEITSPLLILMP